MLFSLPRRLPVVALCLFVLFVPLRASKLDVTTAANLSALLDAATARQEPPGLVVMAVDRGTTLYAHASGLLNVASRKPMPEDAIFRIHSMTKPITTVAALMLYDEGRLGLDDPVSKYLPSFAPQVLVRLDPDGTPVTRPASRPVTIRHLLTHTSGIGYGFDDPSLLKLTASTGKTEIELPLVHDPGARWTYGAGTRVVGHIIERISGQSLDQFVQARVFAPLGMVDTFYRVPDAKRTRIMSRHQRTNGTLVEEQLAAVEESAVWGDGGLFSTAHDYGLFLQMLLNDGRRGDRRLVSARAMRLMRENQIGKLVVTTQVDADKARTRPFPDHRGRDTFSFGFQLASAPAPTSPYVRGKGSMSWGGLRNTHFWLDPNRDVAVVFMTQVLPFYDDEVMKVVAGFENRFYQALNYGSFKPKGAILPR